MKIKNKKIRLKLDPTLQLFIAIGLFAVSATLVKHFGVMDWEVNVFNFVYGWPNFLHPIFFVITQFGSIWILGTLLAVHLAKKKYSVVLRLLLAGMLAYLVSGFAKDIWGRVRPGDILENIANLDYVVRGPGFPSGHTALATAMALTMAYYLPKKYRWIAVVWIVGVGLSRVYLGIHFPMDIIGGFAIGWGSYALFRQVRVYDISKKTKLPK